MSISLEKSIRTCKVRTGYAANLESDRFENANIMVCPVFGGQDLSGRPVCVDSFYTKTAGCNSPMDRVTVENSLRPQYVEYVNLNASGITAPLYGSLNMHTSNEMVQNKELYRVGRVTGSFGGQVAASSQSSCPLAPQVQAQAQINAGRRENFRKVNNRRNVRTNSQKNKVVRKRK